MRIVATFCIPFAASRSCHLCFSIYLYQGLVLHVEELNDLILGILGKMVCQTGW